jgi:hypothetical protein
MMSKPKKSEEEEEEVSGYEIGVVRHKNGDKFLSFCLKWKT